MHIMLVVFEQFILLYGESIRFKCYLETVCWFRGSFGVRVLRLMSATNKVERVFELLLLPKT
jgi:hypothetical protein